MLMAGNILVGARARVACRINGAQACGGGHASCRKSSQSDWQAGGCGQSMARVTKLSEGYGAYWQASLGGLQRNMHFFQIACIVDLCQEILS